MRYMPNCENRRQNVQQTVNSQDGFTIDSGIGPRLRAARRQLRLNQTEMAALGGVSINTQGKYEAPGGLPSIEYLLRIGQAGADWIWIVTGQPAPDSLSAADVWMLDHIRRLDEQTRNALAVLAGSAAGTNSSGYKTYPGPTPLNLPPEVALAQMFEGLLRTMDRTAPLDEQAQLLARRLPIGLSQLRDLLPEQPTIAAAAAPPAARARHQPARP